MHIYKLTFASGKSYIGQTERSIKKRVAQHKQATYRGNSQLPVHCAWRAHGNPTVSVLGTYESRDALNLAEAEFIRSHDTIVPDGYNLDGGGGVRKTVHEQTRRKIGAQAKGRKHSGESIDAIAESSKERWQDPGYRALVDKRVREAWTDEKRSERGEIMKRIWAEKKAAGWVMPEETKEKLRAKVFSEETRKKMSESAKKRDRQPFTDDHKAKIKQHVSASWQDPEIKKRRGDAISAALKAKNAASKDDPAEIERRRQAKLKMWETRRAKTGKTQA